jgi:Protein of unknown function (DUF3800)
LKERTRFELPDDESILSGQFSGMAIDDSGTPGLVAPSVHLHPDRRTWVAVLLPPEDMAEVSAHLPDTIGHICSHLGVSELHFTDIYSGKGSLRDVPLAKRLDAFRIFARVFARLRLPVIVQTISPNNVADQRELLAGLPRMAGVFDLQNPGDLAFVRLLMRVREFVARHASAFHKPVLSLVDEGRFQAGMAVQVGDCLDFAHQKALFFASSHASPLIQLADFAAYAMNKMQWLLAKAERSTLDIRLLEILQEADFQGIDMVPIGGGLDGWTTADFDRVHEEVRRQEGLYPIPGYSPKDRGDA